MSACLASPDEELRVSMIIRVIVQGRASTLQLRGAADFRVRMIVSAAVNGCV